MENVRFQHFAGSAEGPQVVNFGCFKTTYRKLRMCFSLQPERDSRLQGYRKGVEFEFRKWCIFQVTLNCTKFTLAPAASKNLLMCFSLLPGLDSRLQGYRKGVRFEVRKWCIFHVDLNRTKFTLAPAPIQKASKIRLPAHFPGPDIRST